MEVFMDFLSKLQYGIAFLAAAWLLVHWLRPKVIALRNAVKEKAAAAQKSIAEVASSAGPSISPMPSIPRE